LSMWPGTCVMNTFFNICSKIEELPLKLLFYFLGKKAGNVLV